MALLITPTRKYTLIMFGCACLWLGPIALKAPRLITFVSVVGSIVGFVYCFNLADEIHSSGTTRAKRKLQNESITDYHFALEEDAIKTELYLQYNPPQPEPEQSQPSKLVEEAENRAEKPAKQDEDQASIKALIALSFAKGWLSATMVKQQVRIFKDVPPDQIRSIFGELTEAGIGQLRGQGRSLEWSAQAEEE